MPGENLTRDEAAARSALVAVSSYDVSLDLTGSQATFATTTTITFTCTEPGAATFIDLVGGSDIVAVLNGRTLPTSAYDGARLELTELDNVNVVTVSGRARYSRSGEGLHRFTDPSDGAVYTYSQFEVIDCRRMFACFDQPDLKASLTLTVRTPTGWTAVSNSITPDPALDGDTLVWDFAATPAISTYIFALCAGPYHRVSDSWTAPDGRKIPLTVLCRASLAAHLDAGDVIEVTKQGFAYFEELFATPYPFTKYDQIFVPEFNAGAMENAGAVTIRDEYVFRSRTTDAAFEGRAETVLHELAHMWFGDLVTMAWWDDLWLNESFATYVSNLAQAEATRWPQAWTTFATTMKSWAYRQDQLPSTHPISADIVDIEAVEVNFDGITYAKGASVLKQLVAWVGRDAFVAGVRTYFARHAWGNTTLADLLVCLEETSGRDLKSWSKEWLQTAGVNTLRPVLELAADGTIASLSIAQEAPAAHPVLRSQRIALGLYDLGADGVLARRSQVELDVVGASTPVPALVGVTMPDLLLLNDDDLGYAKIRLDGASLATLLNSIAGVSDSLARALCWSAAWDMTRDGEMTAHDYLTLVVSGVASVADISSAVTVLRQASAAVTFYSAPARRTSERERLAGGLLELTRAAEPGSDHHLAFARAFAEHARTSADLAVLSGWLEGRQVLPGLTVDTDLRWLLLGSLAARGAANEERIAAELERDATDRGELAARAARGAQPTPEAKAAAWHDAVEREDLANFDLEASVRGFSQTDQQDLLRPYVSRYFQVLPELWASRSNEMGQTIVLGLYPSTLVEQETLDATDAFLASQDDRAVPPGLRRLIVESRDSLARSLRCQAADL